MYELREARVFQNPVALAAGVSAYRRNRHSFFGFLFRVFKKGILISRMHHNYYLL
jgi:hypothetical protein